MKLLWFGDLASTGFGTVTADAGKALLNLGVDVRFVSQNEFKDLPEPFLSRTVDQLSFVQVQKHLEDGKLVEGVDAEVSPEFVPNIVSGKAEGVKLTNGELWGDWKPDAVMLLGDFVGMRWMALKNIDAFTSVPTFHYVPIEGIGLPPSWADLWRIIHPIAMSKFGQMEIAKVTGEIPPLVYHGVDSASFHPATPSDPLTFEIGEKTINLVSKEQCKAFLGVHPRATFVLRTDRHMPRKGYNMLLRSMAPVLADRPNVVLGLHCRSIDQGGNLMDSISKLPVNIQKQVSVPDLGAIPREVLVAMYNAADLYVSVSAEGFGLTIAEALACGTPAVGIDYSAVPEVIGPAGVTVPVEKVFDNEYDHFWALPNEEAFGAEVAYLIDHPAKRRALGAEGPKHIRENFRWDVAAERFADIVSKPVASDLATLLSEVIAA